MGAPVCRAAVRAGEYPSRQLHQRDLLAAAIGMTAGPAIRVIRLYPSDPGCISLVLGVERPGGEFSVRHHRKARAQPATGPVLTTERVWNEIEQASFAIISYVTPAGKPRSSGVVYAAVGHRLYVVTAAESWKARQISNGNQVALTVPIRRGGLLSLVAPIPPATISFHAKATVHPAGSVSTEKVPKKLASQLPKERRGTGCLLELVPEGNFLTYGLGVSLQDLAKPEAALAHVPAS